jgi:hypothetical protein
VNGTYVTSEHAMFFICFHIYSLRHVVTFMQQKRRLEKEKRSLEMGVPRWTNSFSHSEQAHSERTKLTTHHDSTISYSHFDVHAGLDADGSDLLDNLGRGVEINDALVDAHLEPVPGLGALAARGLAGGDAQRLGGHPDRAADLERLLLGAAGQFGAYCIK